MKFPDALGSGEFAHRVSFEQIFGLMLKMVEVRMGWEAFGWHLRTSFPYARGPHMTGRKLVRCRWIVTLQGGLEVLSADRMRPLARHNSSVMVRASQAVRGKLARTSSFA